MKKEIIKDIEEIMEKFERNGMIQALKDAEDFNPHQFELMMKLIANELLPTVLQNYEKKILKQLKPDNIPIKI